ncbi:hypothetical protein ASG76_05280 [Nocardioides sp. Soil774]|uniref:hypothetical protein n=1 Tax=Nocardioides sp. Soil774 TaxID=1736408 RepID=UPI0006F3892F|nr:hypothetical protein [Nocardioides sp. Soil774]KRE95102.1 hypothetical protein ASG76_05280 [Nocardioides sp. Soil774]
MAARATTQENEHTAQGVGGSDGGRAARLRRTSWRERIRARLRDDYEEDGVFRPVRLSVWADWGISAAIIAVAAASFVGFFVWLAQTRGA